MKKIPFTKEGLTQLQSEYNLLEKRRKPAVDDLRSAREKGDLSENSAYRAAKSKLFSIDNRIRKIRAILNRAFVVENKNRDYVDMGTYVTIVDDTENSRTFRIVNTFESGLDNNLISSFSPLGKALLKKRINDEITVFTPDGLKKFRILKIANS